MFRVAAICQRLQNFTVCVDPPTRPNVSLCRLVRILEVYKTTEPGEVNGA